MLQPSTAVQTSPLTSSYCSLRHAPPPPTHTSRWPAFFRYNVVQRTLSAAVLAPSLTVFLWLSPAIATSTVCSFMTSTCSYEYACLANRIRLRILTKLEALECSLLNEAKMCDVSPKIGHRESERDALSVTNSNSFTNHTVTDPNLDPSEVRRVVGGRLSDDDRTIPTRRTATRLFREEQEARELAQVNTELLPQAPRLQRCAITDVAAYALKGHEWVAAVIVSALMCSVSSSIFLLAIQDMPVLNTTDFYASRGFYTVATGFVAAMCACMSPDWQYAVVIFVQNGIFTILTLHSTACPINVLSCHMAIKPAQIVLAGMVIFLVFRFATSRNRAEAFLTFALDVVGLIYIIGTLSVLVAFVDDERRPLYRKLLIALLYVVWASDTGAYLTGKLLALVNYPYYHPLAAHLSKNKDYEGTVGAIGFGIVAMVVTSNQLELPGSFGAKVLFTVVAVIIGRIGDLFESLLKRAAGVKDSGTLIPGHGGVLDRIDALMFATLVFSRYYASVL
ncbi:hypothetical protein CCR75_002246 [Bremia lactucae]|uniref:Phosphatidate cytidylyltransferase n=1 Tax=Bremia lactucae TaxID=4779 RepID=A0A976IG42_BRELC|nr:hypothetical protein CCR75_002246 [Bremia lactucae]